MGKPFLRKNCDGLGEKKKSKVGGSLDDEEPRKNKKARICRLEQWVPRKEVKEILESRNERELKGKEQEARSPRFDKLI